MDTQIALNHLKNYFESQLEEKLNLTKVSSPVMLKEGTGINDNLNGIERTVSFDVLDLQEGQIEIVQSLAKWKRMALVNYNFSYGEGLFADMRAIRRDEMMDNVHSIYVDQWDWEKVIFDNERNIDTLQKEVKKIYTAIKKTEEYIFEQFPCLKPVLPSEIYFVTTQELEDLYPELSPKEREDRITKEYGAVFIMQIGGKLTSGHIHDGRSPDYDDWTLNGDIVLWYPVLERSLEISSMGIRVDGKRLLDQLQATHDENRIELDYHQAILSGELPSSIGGGIGQSRLSMFLLKKAHIGEVQVSVWNNKTIRECCEGNIPLL